MDPIADMLVAVKNGYMAKKTEVSIPYSRFKEKVIKVLEKENFVGDVEKKDKSLQVKLLYKGHQPNLTQIKKISKPSLRVYSKGKRIKTIRGGKGLIIISTSKGVMSGKEARKKGLGGELICQVW